MASASVSSRWCGVTSAVTCPPFDFAQRMISTEPAVETWQTCSADPTCAASRQSRAITASSATAGQPVRPRMPETSPSFICAPSVSLGSWACGAITPPKALTYSSARRIRTASDTHRPSSEKTLTRAAESAIAPSSASRLPAMPALTAQPPDLLDDPGGIGYRLGVGHRVHRREPAERGRGSAGGDGLGVLPAWFPQVRVQVNQAGQRDKPAGVKYLAADSLPSGVRAELGDHAAGDEDVGGLAAERPRAPDQPGAVASRAPRVGAAAPCAAAACAAAARAAAARAAAARPGHDCASAPPSNRYSTAIRTLTPLATCSTIVDLAESATSAAISTPRFIGPGCMTMACSGSSATRAASRP